MSRTIFSGSSALSKIALMFEFTMSENREKIPIARSSVVSGRGLVVCGLLRPPRVELVNAGACREQLLCHVGLHPLTL
jgi:hypothetical protein